MKKYSPLIIGLLLLVLSGEAYSQVASITKTGTTAASFLKISVGARSIGMGGAFAAEANDISSIYWNPAGLTYLQQNAAAFDHVNWIADIQYDVASAAVIIPDLGTLAASFATLTIGEMEVTTTNYPEGTGEKFTAGATMLNLSYARALTDQFSIGFNVKYIREFIWNEVAQGFALDIGTLYIAPVLNGLRIGASMSNFGAKMRMEGRDALLLVKTGAGGMNIVNAQYELDSYELPLIFRVGLATDLLKEENNRFTLSVDAVHPNDNTEYINSGIEYSWANIVSLRAGWKSAFERGGEQGLTAGIGLQYTLANPIDFVVDYAYQDFGRLKEVHYVSFGLRF
ncbi:MAG: PorV/PorQ family protein [Bacteroidetes bacterium]|nr:PorV/PorQ family protein [Bacteroidota bacterium]